MPQYSLPGTPRPVGVSRMFTFTVTTTDQALTLPTAAPPWPNGYIAIQNPQYPIGSSTLNTTPIQVEWTGGNSTTEGESLSPGQADSFNAPAVPHVSVPPGSSSVTINVWY